MTNYDTVTLGTGETRKWTVGDGEALENLLIDQNAPGAMAKIEAVGSDWVVRNVGIRGQVTGQQGIDTTMLRCWVTDDDGTGLMENVYVGDGTDGHNGINGMWISYDHAGELTLRRMYVSNWADNGLYGSDAGNQALGADNGTVKIEQCYAKDCNISGYRLGSSGSYVRDSTVVQTGEIPPYTNGAVKARGIYAKHQSGITAENCDIIATKGPAIQVSDGAEIELTNCRIEGDFQVKDGAIHGGKGGTPNPNPPAGVPTTAGQAASGTAPTTTANFAGLFSELGETEKAAAGAFAGLGLAYYLRNQ